MATEGALTEATLAALFPPWCTAVVCGPGFETEPHVRREELALVSPRAVEKRRREFALGRSCARLALRRAGLPDAPAILQGPRGEPLWPAGWVGAIAHASGVAAAVVAPAVRAVGLGLDIEDLDRELERGIVRMVCLPDECPWVDAGDWQHRLKLVFSAKESVYKAVYPTAKVFFGFHEARLRWADEATFEGELLQDFTPHFAMGFGFRGKAAVAGSFVATGMVIEPRGAGAPWRA